MKESTYIAIDLKSFYASVEAIERGLDPMTVNLVVADASRTETVSYTHLYQERIMESGRSLMPHPKASARAAATLMAL